MKYFYLCKIQFSLFFYILFYFLIQKFATANLASNNLLKSINEDDINQNYARERSQWQPVRFSPSRSRHATVMFLQEEPEIFS